MSDAVLDVAPPPPRRKTRTTADTGQNDPQKCATSSSNVVYHQWTLQLAPLASQHHMSEYSRIKYGHQGCPISYAPLSLHLPDIVRGLRERQEKYENQVLWWPCASSTTPTNRESSPLIPAARQRAALATGGAMTHPDLQKELSDALSDSITIQSNQTDTDNSVLHIKTSETHPINISQIIPPESLVAISSHLTPTKGPCPVLFEIHLSYSLDRVAGYPQLFPSHVDLPIPIPSISQHKYLPSNDLRSSLTGAVNAALNTKISLPPLPVPSSRILLSLKRNLKSHTTPDGVSENDVANPNPKLAPCHSTFASTQTAPQTPQSRRPPMLTLPTTYALHPFIRPPTAPSPPNKNSKFRASKSSTPSSRQGTANQRPFRLGNLLLSSCPGKKGSFTFLARLPSINIPVPCFLQQVRLSGPVRGRSAVCRDLDVDLRRMKMLGVRCVVCCLDDEELEFLISVSWLEYCQVAHREGLDVLRIPLPEGLTPLSPKSLDADLDRIMERYTLQGISVLVHCRGGVGRAGLVACCWMLKLGLCGWIETDIPPSVATTSVTEIKRDDNPSDAFRWDSETVVRRDTLQLVERVIEVVRRRRSVKAIETLEQVQFLVEYVDYLRTCGHIVGDSSNS